MLTPPNCARSIWLNYYNLRMKHAKMLLSLSFQRLRYTDKITVSHAPTIFKGNRTYNKLKLSIYRLYVCFHKPMHALTHVRIETKEYVRTGFSQSLVQLWAIYIVKMNMYVPSRGDIHVNTSFVFFISGSRQVRLRKMMILIDVFRGRGFEQP